MIELVVCLALISGCREKQENVNEGTVNIQEENLSGQADDGNGYEAEPGEEKNDTSDVLVSNGKIFSTEYDVEDYCHGCFIVSKNEGLLYGVLDRNGEEILPVKYDSIEFMNGEEVREGENENLYIRTKYEDQYTVVNSKGEVVLDKDVSYVDYELGTGNSESAFFVEISTQNDWVHFYKEDGMLLSELNCGENDWIELRYITNEIYLLARADFESISNGVKVISKDVTLYNRENQIVTQWNEMGFGNSVILDGQFVFYLYANDGVYYRYTMDESGNLSESGEISQEEAKLEIASSGTANKTGEYYLGKEKAIRLYQSNGTWKLVDANDNPLYDERYYQCIPKYGCYFLVNENNEMCLIDRNGNMVVDYGWLTLNENQGYFNGAVITSDNFFAGDDGVCFTLGGNGVNDVYFFCGE